MSQPRFHKPADGFLSQRSELCHTRGVLVHSQRGLRTAILAVFLVLCFAIPHTAKAYEDQATIALRTGWGYAPALENFPNHGPLTALDIGFGIDDAWGVQLNLGYAIHPAFGEGAPYHQLLAGAEATYIFDYLTVVPILGAGLDILPSHDERTWAVDFALHFRLGLDYLLSREIVVGFDLRPYLRLTNVELNPIYLSATLRIGVLIDYF